jgi:transcriptional regulator with XRE-family HTH domain
MTFGERLRAIRRAAGLTQVELAARSGVSQPSISQYEAGDTEPAWSTVAALCRALGVTPDAFWADGRMAGATGAGAPQAGE